MNEISAISSQNIEKVSKDNVVNLTIDTISKGKQVLIFNNSKNSSEATSDRVAESIKKVENKEILKELSDKILKSLPNPTKQCRRLSKVVLKGVSFHHSGLTAKQRTIIEKGFKDGYIKVISSTPTLCLAKGTRVWSNEKQISIEKFRKKKVFALNGSNLNQMFPSKIANNGIVEDLIEVQSVSGHKIKATANHKFLILRKKNKLIIPLNEIKKTDLIATVGNLDIKEKKVHFSIFLKDNQLLFEDRIISKEIFYLIGAMLGDGYSGAEFKEDKIKYKGSPSIVGMDKEVFENVIFSCKNLGIFFRNEKNSNGVPQLVLGKNNWFREFLLRCGVDIGVNKNISSDLKVSNKENISFLLSGLFDTDGYVEKRGQLGYSSISEQLISDIQFCLYRFNIISRIRKRKKNNIRINNKEYNCKDQFELVISENTSILNFYKFIGFKIKRKQEMLREVVEKINSNILFKECKNCDYKLYSDLFGGRTKGQKEWGLVKLRIINELFLKGSLSSNDFKKYMGSEIRKNSSRLNHHYELINKKKLGKFDWVWSLNDIGGYIGNYIGKYIGKTTGNGIGKEIEVKLSKKLESKSYDEFFLENFCLCCNSKLNVERRKTWKDSNKEGDIFWDQIKSIKKIKEKIEVFDVVLPTDKSNDHMFVAEGFITHNSAGLNLPAYKVIVKDYKRYSNRGFNDIPVLEYHQMSGRAGRPRHEDVGLAVLCVKTEEELNRVIPKYVFGNPEEIISKLAVEPTLKMYMLSLISMDMINTKDEIRDFFKNTLYAHQYKDLDTLFLNLFRILGILKEYGFVNQEDDYYIATQLGKKVSELYLGPDTANYFLLNIDEFFKRFSSDEVSKYDVYSLIHFVVNTIEMKPLFRVGKAEEEVYVRKMDDIADSLVTSFDPFEMDYTEFINTLKTTDIFIDWINEAPEDYICDKYKITPGELHYKITTIDWLFYCLEEISVLKKSFYFKNYLNKMRLRFKFGIREDIIPFVSLKGVGRVRARSLYKAGFKKIADLKKAEFAQISRVIGDKLTIKIKEQLTGVIDSDSERGLAKPKEIKIREVLDEEIEQLVEAHTTFEKERNEVNKNLDDYF